MNKKDLLYDLAMLSLTLAIFIEFMLISWVLEKFLE